jgi:exodeoxyribonuclease VII large subunit
MYAAQLQRRLREFSRVQVFGEVCGFKVGGAKVYFELRDAGGAMPCSMWRKEFEALGLGALEGAQVVVAGGCDFYPGSRTSSPGFSFDVFSLRIAGEGDLLAQLAELRRRLAAEGLFEPQKRLARPALPRCIGVVTGENGKARDDVLAGLRRRGWSGRLVWAFAPVQDRHAAPRVARALQDLAACPEVEVVIVARGGGSLADLFAFCDETLCRTVSMLRVPVIASVGHHTDTTLIDDVAAVACSTPTHAAEVAVPVDCVEARRRLHAAAQRLDGHGRRAVVTRARTLATLARAPAAHVDRHRLKLHQQLREMRASASRGIEGRERFAVVAATVLARRAGATEGVVDRAARQSLGAAGTLQRASLAATARRLAALEASALALSAHDPQRTLERGYALVEDPSGAAVTSADEARTLDAMTLRLHDGTVPVRRA